MLPDKPGIWRFRAEWTGRDMAGLWLESAEGKTLHRDVGPSPLELTVQLDETGIIEARRYLLRFNPTTTRGRLAGVLEVYAPARDVVAPPPAEPEAPTLRGPAACLAPLLDQGDASREIEGFARALESASRAELAWALEWTARLREILDDTQTERARRRELDTLWEHLRLHPAPSEDVARAFRGMLAAIEDLARREQGGRQREALAARRRLIAETLACLEG